MFFFHAQSFATPFFIESCTDIIGTEGEVRRVLNYQKLLMPYKNFKGDPIIVYAFSHNRSYTLSDQASTIANIADAYQLDADMKEKISAICYMHDAQISKNEIIMIIDDDELYTKLNEYGKMLLEIENLFTQRSAYSQ